MNATPATPRSDSQLLARRTNGCNSPGPITAAGKDRSSLNATSHGVSAKRVIMPGETLEEHRRQLDAWTTTLGPRTAGEAILVARISDAFLRLERIDQQVRRVEDEGVEGRVKKTESSRRLAAVSDALQAVAALAVTFENSRGSVDVEDVRALGPAMRRTLEMAEAADVPQALVLRLRDGMNGVLIDSILDVGPEALDDLGAVACDVEAYLSVAKAVASAALDEERIQLAQDPTLGDPAALGRLDLYRRRTMREIETCLSLLREVRAAASVRVGELGSFVEVELRVIERRALPVR